MYPHEKKQTNIPINFFFKIIWVCVYGDLPSNIYVCNKLHCNYSSHYQEIMLISVLNCIGYIESFTLPWLVKLQNAQNMLLFLKKLKACLSNLFLCCSSRWWGNRLCPTCYVRGRIQLHAPTRGWWSPWTCNLVPKTPVAVLRPFQPWNNT